NQEWQILTSKAILLAEHLNLIEFETKCYIYRHCLGLKRKDRKLGIALDIRALEGKALSECALLTPVAYKKTSGTKKSHDDDNYIPIVEKVIQVTLSTENNPHNSHKIVHEEVSQIVKDELKK